MGAMRSSFFIVDKDHIGEHIQADMWDDGWATERTNMPKKKQKIKYGCNLVILNNTRYFSRLTPLRLDLRAHALDSQILFAVAALFCSYTLYYIVQRVCSDITVSI